MNYKTTSVLGGAGSVVCGLILWVALGNSAVCAQDQPFSVPPSDAPELAVLGQYSVGVRTLRLVNPKQPDLPNAVLSGGKELQSDRVLQVELWYPSAAIASDVKKVRYAAKLPRLAAINNGANSASKDLSSPGLAIRDAVPVSANGKKFPLVLVSHGYGGWGTFMSYLTENIASKGYVVAAIDHADMPFTDGGSFGLSFGSVLIHRARDQQFVLQQLIAMAENADDDMGRLIDAQAIGVVGYSMGGFGALTTAGAGYAAASPTFKQLPADVIAPLVHGNAEYIKTRPPNIRALVLFAPWGGQTANRSWGVEGLKSVKAPTLVVVGDQDDIVDYKDGVSWIFENLKTSDRYMLVYQNARHNVGGNAAPTAALADFAVRDYFEEPVWRKDRLMAINQHFVTAFLDVHLKGERAKTRYLDLVPIRSNEARWPAAFGQNTGGTFATGLGDTAHYWPGFQRRWAVGLEMHHKKAGE
jgi:predicted dienelactone hydrolase